MASNNVYKLANRLEDNFNIVVDVETFYRTRAGRHLMSSGAFSWTIAIKEYQGNRVYKWLGGYEALSNYIKKTNKLDLSSDDLNTFELFYQI